MLNGNSFSFPSTPTKDHEMLPSSLSRYGDQSPEGCNSQNGVLVFWWDSLMVRMATPVRIRRISGVGQAELT